MTEVGDSATVVGEAVEPPDRGAATGTGTMSDPLLTPCAADAYWTITNLAEAWPAVLTPMGWSLAGQACEAGTRGALHSIGALGSAETGLPERAEDWAYGCFYGHAAMRVDFFARMGNRIPGTTGEAAALNVAGVVPPGVEEMEPVRARYPVVAVRFPLTFMRVPRRVARSRERTERLWSTEIARTPQLGLDDARAQLASGATTFIAAIEEDATKILAGIAPIYDQLKQLAAESAVDVSALEGGYGSHEELRLIADLWDYSRDRLDLDSLLARHGFHGPREGEVSSRVWREDPSPLLRAAEAYRAMDDDENPLAAEPRRRDERLVAERELVASLPRRKRPGARLLLRLAHRYLPLRGKEARLQGLDIARSAARRVGEHLASDGTLAEPADIFFLTWEEALEPPHDSRNLVAYRRERWLEHHEVDVPVHWQGMPQPRSVQVELQADHGTDGVSGEGVSGGVAEGRVRVITDPAAADAMIEAGEILVAHTTDPSWASLMFPAAALVVDIGGQLSHAAVVARELGLPCVMGTGNGTKALRTGDLIRVDGSNGAVKVLERGS